MKIRDTFALVLTSGLAGNAAKGLVDTLLFRKKISTITHRDIATGIFSDAPAIRTTLGHLLGHLGDLCIGTMVAAPIVWVLRRTGTDLYPLKGMVLGHAAWVVALGASAHLGASRVYPMSPRTNLALLASECVYGAVAALTAVHLGHPDLFPGTTAPRQKR